MAEETKVEEKVEEKTEATAAPAEETKAEEVKPNPLQRTIELTISPKELDARVAKALREKAKKLEANIEPRLLTAFKRIRKGARNGLAVVYVQRGACGGCFNKIPPQKQLDIKLRKKVIVCEYCGRIMIDPELAGIEE